MDWQEDEDDDGEAAFAARLNAHDGMLPAYDDINGGPQNVLEDDGVEPEAAEPRQPGEAAEPEAAELGEPGEAAVPEAEPPAAPPAAPNPSKPPKLESKTALLKASARAWPTAVFVLLSVVSNGLPSAPRMLSLGAEVADPHTLLTGSMSESFHQYVRLPDGDTVNHDRTRVIHGCTFEELQRRACGSVAEIGQNWLDWLEQVMSRAPQSTPFVLATWNGYKTGAYSLLCTELQRHGLSLLAELQVIDVADVVSSRKAFGTSTDLSMIATSSLRESTPRLRATTTGASAV
eukprot:4644380-Prymnesium_polylepis.1